MKRLIIPAILLGLLALGTVIYFQGIPKTVNLMVNGESTEVNTSSWNVSGFLEEQGLVMTEQDSIDPPPSSLLIGDEEISILDPPPSSLLIGDEEISIQQASWFTVDNDGSSQSTFARFITLEELFSELKIDLTPHDLVYLDGAQISTDAPLRSGSNHSIQIRKPKQVVLTGGKTSRSFETSAPTLGAGLWLEDVYLDIGDYLNLPVDSPVAGSVEAELEDSKEITIQLSNGTIKSKTNGNTVGEALSDSGTRSRGWQNSSNPRPRRAVFGIRADTIRYRISAGCRPGNR